MTDLKTGDIIEVHGWVMLKNIHPGRYLIKIKPRNGWMGDIVMFYKLRKGDIVDKRFKPIGHYDGHVFPCIRTIGNLGWNDLNKIEIIKRNLENLE